ncbi:hypothetical protein KC332_g7556 [Hortaea werneckii]|nr:hypothetical protein KC358_g7234 [Hortaea werneckii]KAI6830771.1 hypothetical protein KC350_g7493 [Hortaea werneckii]KAI6929940.1 hypothetical protein KC348_g7704 [Hortaea werneckii]KAI6933931.1 hypothetical protein KC341_g7952 [Hortaea werneckii]KAI6962300.1 hypothetical protein KC321_g11838 [Hortaea werneckii]
MAATPVQSFQLDRNIFNRSFYDDVRNFWFEGMPSNASTAPFPVLQKWWGINRTDEEKKAFDDECRAKFGSALDSIGPSKLALPAFKSYEEDIEHSDELSAPFFSDVKAAQNDDERKAADTMLSMIILLDQMPRQIYREPEELSLVYNHYDRLASSLVRSCMSLKPSPVDHQAWKGRPAYKTWIVMPLVHTEHIPTHMLQREKLAELRQECEAAKDEAALGYLERAEQASVEHLDPLKRFGRYPHRNECLGRKNSPEEDEFMKTAQTFGVKQSKKTSEQKDEL